MKAGIEAVTAVCSAPQDSDSFSFSIFEILKQVFSWRALGWHPYMVLFIERGVTKPTLRYCITFAVGQLETNGLHFSR